MVEKKTPLIACHFYMRIKFVNINYKYHSFSELLFSTLSLSLSFIKKFFNIHTMYVHTQLFIMLYVCIHLASVCACFEQLLLFTLEIIFPHLKYAVNFLLLQLHATFVYNYSHIRFLQYFLNFSFLPSYLNLIYYPPK